MARVPHLPQILQGPLTARPPADRTPEWVWYYAWDDAGGAFHRPTPTGWLRATPDLAGPWQTPTLAGTWTQLTPAFQYRLNGGAVEFTGGVSRAAGALPATVTTLPAGYRPPGSVWLPVVVSNGLSFLNIASNGVVTAYTAQTGAGNTNAGLLFDGVRFTV